MKKTDIKKLLNYLLKENLDYSVQFYTEWETNCNRFKATSFDENMNVKKMKKLTYNEVCKDTINEAIEIMPDDIKKCDEETIVRFLDSEWLFNIFIKHNS